MRTKKRTRVRNKTRTIKRTRCRRKIRGGLKNSSKPKTLDYRQLELNSRKTLLSKIQSLKGINTDLKNRLELCEQNQNIDPFRDAYSSFGDAYSNKENDNQSSFDQKAMDDSIEKRKKEAYLNAVNQMLEALNNESSDDETE